MSHDRDAFFIDGGWAAPAGTDVLEVVSPHSEQVVARVPEGSTGDIDAAVAAARRAFDEGPWPRMSPQERIDVVQAFSGLYAGKLAEMADLITLEMGSPTSFSNLAQSPAPWMQIEAFLGDRAGVPVGGGARRRARLARSSYAASRSAWSRRSRRGTSRSSRSCPSWCRRCWPAARSW